VTGAADVAVWPDDAVEVGRIMDAWGVKGWFKIRPYAADPQALFSSRRWFLKPDDAAPTRVAHPPPLLRITQAREHADLVVATAQDVPDRDAARALRGARVFVSRASFPTPAADEFYWVDLIGMAVVNRANEALGTVIGLADTGPHCILRIDPGGGEPERLIPFVSAFIDSVDQSRRCITADWGLDY